MAFTSLSGLPAGMAAKFVTDGFVSIDGLTTPNDLIRIRSLLDPLFESFDSLPASRALDLAGTTEDARPRSPEVNRAVSLVPALRQTETFARCRAIARALLGVPVGYVFDHAIYKAPQNDAPTHWHQDEAYTGRPVPMRTVHFWIPLQEATVQNGCMWFVPGSHRNGMLEHREIVARAGGSVLATEPANPEAAVACELQPGGVTVHHPLTLHYTGANRTDEYRRAWIVHFGAYGRLGAFHPRNLWAKLRG